MTVARLTRIAVGAFLAALLVGAALVPATALRVEDLGPLIVLALSLLCIALLVLAPVGRSR